MAELYEYACLGLVAAWAISRPLFPALGAGRAALAGLALAGALMMWQWLDPGVAALAALFSPVSLGLALLAGADLARPFGLRPRRWGTGEMLVLLVAYVAFLHAALGWMQFDPYAQGYAGVAPAMLALVLGGYAFWRRDGLLAAITLGAQLAWLSGIGSENFFDHLAGALLVPALLIGLARRLRQWRRGD